MKTLFKSSALSLLVFGLVGCGSDMAFQSHANKAVSAASTADGDVDDADQSGDQQDDVMESLTAAQANVDAVSGGVVLGAAAFDPSKMTDDEIIAAVIKDLEDTLKHADEQIKKLKESGTVADAELVKMFEQLKVGTNELINRLKTDAEFRKSLVNSIRNPPQPPSPVDFAEACKRVAEDLKNESLPKEIKAGAQAFYDQNCK